MFRATKESFQGVHEVSDGILQIHNNPIDIVTFNATDNLSE